MVVLIVEDETLIRLTTADEVTGRGWIAVEAATVAEALACWRLARADAAIVDVGLPDGSGADLIVQLRADAPGLPIVVHSGYSQHDPALAGLPSDVVFIAKPTAEWSTLTAALVLAYQKTSR